MTSLLYPDTLAARIRQEAGYLQTQHDLAKQVLDIASDFTSWRVNDNMSEKLAGDLRHHIKDFTIRRKGLSIRIFHEEKLPESRWLEIDLRATKDGKFDYLDLMVRQFGGYLLGKEQAEELLRVVDRLPQLVETHNQAVEKLQKAQSAFGPAGYLLHRRRATDMRE